jgi:hypothetical protein
LCFVCLGVIGAGEGMEPFFVGVCNGVFGVCGSFPESDLVGGDNKFDFGGVNNVSFVSVLVDDFDGVVGGSKFFRTMVRCFLGDFNFFGGDLINCGSFVGICISTCVAIFQQTIQSQLCW